MSGYVHICRIGSWCENRTTQGKYFDEGLFSYYLCTGTLSLICTLTDDKL